jgi:C1A family cysteine protease
MRKYGWKRQRIDQRDKKYTLRRLASSFPPAFSTRAKQPPIMDQGDLGACTGFGNKRVAQYALMKIPAQSNIDLSALFIYYCERMLDGTISQDSGANIRDGIKALAQYGACEEAIWPYVVSAFASAPPRNAFINALQFEALTYENLDSNGLPVTEQALKDALMADHPVVYGQDLYACFEGPQTAATGIVQMPQPSEQYLGGHCTVITGWDDNYKGLGPFYEVANSWGSSWGDQGYFWMPRAYIQSRLASDFWVLPTIK